MIINYRFSVCLSVHTCRVPHLHPIILPQVPCPFWGGTPSDYSQVPPQGVPQSQVGGTPILAGGTLSQVRMRYPLARTGWGTPSQTGWGTPRDRLCLDILCRGLYTSCGFPQEDCLVKIHCVSVRCFSLCRSLIPESIFSVLVDSNFLENVGILNLMWF